MKTFNNANISTLQQQQQQSAPFQLQQQQLLNLRNQLNQNRQPQQQHQQHHHQLRDISEQQQVAAINSDNDDNVYESLPEAAEQRMQFEDMNYDNDENDNTERPNRSLMDMDIISVDGNFEIPADAKTGHSNFKVEHDMGQPIKVLTLGAESQENLDDQNEGSANFSNNNDDDDDDDDDDDNGDDVDDGDDKTDENTNKNNDNNNGAIKIISTPLDKVGIFYDEHESSSRKTETTHSFTDFDALSPDPKSNHNSNSKITPVLTPDGKVALLYHEDGETDAKEEPIFNTTKRISVGDDNNKHTNNNSQKKVMHDDSATSNNSNNDDDDDYDYDDDEDEDDETNDDEHNDRMGNNLNDAVPVRQNDGQDQQTAADHVSETDAVTVAPGSSSALVRPTDSVLPMINRPLSEVLGIKKNQFKQFRIKDSATTTTTARSHTITTTKATSTFMGGSSSPWPQPAHALATGLEPQIPMHSPTASEKFNFGIGPPGPQEVDFSRDNIMLSERNKAMEAAAGVGEQKVEQIVEKKLQEEVINLAILPILEEELERLQQQNRHYYRPRPKHTEAELSDIHCVMQIIMGIAAVSTVFGMLGTFFKQRILDQLRMLH